MLQGAGEDNGEKFASNSDSCDLCNGGDGRILLGRMNTVGDGMS